MRYFKVKAKGIVRGCPTMIFFFGSYSCLSLREGIETKKQKEKSDISFLALWSILPEAMGYQKDRKIMEFWFPEYTQFSNFGY